MDLIVISSPDIVAHEATIVNALFESGLSIFHCRKPEWTKSQVGELLQGISFPYRNRVTLHQHHELADSFQLNRMHFTEAHRNHIPTHVLQTHRNAGMTLSTSIHQLADYTKVADWFDYVFYGPVFHSISKPGYTSVVSEGFTLPPRKATKARRIGIGGIDESNLTQALGYGFDGVAVLGTLWTQSGQAVDTFIRLKQLIDTYTL